MRVTLFHCGFPEYTIGLANALAQKGEITLIHPHGLADICNRLAAPEVHLVPFEKPALRRDPRNLLAMQKAFRLINRSRPDVLHVQEMFDYAYDLCSAWTHFPALVTTIHDVVPHPGDGHQAPGLAYSKAIGCWRSRRIIVHTERMKKQLAARFRLRAQKICVVPHAELGSLYQKLASLAGIAANAREPETLLFFGRIWKYKGLRYLLDAFELLQHSMPTAKLIIAGTGGDLAVNERRIASLSGIEVIRSFVPAEKVAGLFERSSVVVLPYIEASQSGVSAIGFTTGPVVVASRVGGLADLIEDGYTGLLVPPKNPGELARVLVEILQDHARQTYVRNNAEALGEGPLSWKTIADRTFEVYAQAIAPTR